MALNFVVVGQLQVSLEDARASGAVDLGQNFPFTQRADFERVYSGAVTADPVSFGTIETAGAKGVLVKVTLGTATIAFVDGATNGTLEWPLAPGAYFLYVNPAGGFPTGALVTTTAAATVKFIAVS